MATLAEKWFNDGVEKGIEQGLRKGLVEGLELAVIFKFGEGAETERIMEAIGKIKDTEKLKNIRKDIMDSVTASELLERLS